MAAPSSSAGTSKSGSNIDVSEAVNHLIQGKRHMLVQDYASAVSSLQSATEIFVEKYGEVANECGEAYFNYGKSLLELARMETGVLGNALDGVPEGEEEEEDKESEDSESNEDQVEDPDKLTDDEKKKICNDVMDAIEENSRDLDAKVSEWKERESKNLDSDQVDKSKGESISDELADDQTKSDNNLKQSDVSMNGREDVDNKVANSTNEKVIKENKIDDVSNGNKKNIEGENEETVTKNGEHENRNGSCRPISNGDCNSRDGANEEIVVKNVEHENENGPCGQNSNGDHKSLVRANEETVTKSGEHENGNDSCGQKSNENDDEDEQDEDKEVEIDKSPAKDENDENESQDEEEKEDKEEEVTNLQLAWEVIELSKIIFERQSEDNKVMKLKTADAYLKLGEIAIESGNYHQASEDLSKCLSIQEKELDSDDRLIAETYYQLGLAFSFDSKFDEGTKHYEKALDVIKTRISNLEKSIPEESDHDKKEKITREVEELKDIIKEINSKIEDTIDMKRNAMKAQADAIKEALAQQKVIGGEEASCSSAPSCSSSNPFADSNTASSFNSFSSASPTKPVSNIGHLVKKKRKAEDNPSQLELKRVCSTDSETKPDVQTNGTGDHKDDKSQVA